LQHARELGSYQTAWAWLHKFRRVMVRPGRDRLAGAVEVDESYRGGVAPGKHGRGADKKTPLLIAVERRGSGLGRVRFACVAETGADSLLPAIEDLIAPGGVVAPDGHAGYSHDRHSLHATGDPARWLFYRLLEQAVQVEPTPPAKLLGGAR